MTIAAIKDMGIRAVMAAMAITMGLIPVVDMWVMKPVIGSKIRLVYVKLFAIGTNNVDMIAVLVTSNGVISDRTGTMETNTPMATKTAIPVGKAKPIIADMEMPRPVLSICQDRAAQMTADMLADQSVTIVAITAKCRPKSVVAMTDNIARGMDANPFLP